MTTTQPTATELAELSAERAAQLRAANTEVERASALDAARYAAALARRRALRTQLAELSADQLTPTELRDGADNRIGCSL